MKIMIADDAGFIRQIIREVYEQAGHEIVAEASNGPDTILFAVEQEPDLLVLDIVLPELNGLEAAVEIRQQLPNLKMVATSSLTGEAMLEKAQKAGCFYFLKKPFTKADLLRVVELARPQVGRDVKHG